MNSSQSMSIPLTCQPTRSKALRKHVRLPPNHSNFKSLLLAKQDHRLQCLALSTQCPGCLGGLTESVKALIHPLPLPHPPPQTNMEPDGTGPMVSTIFL